MGLVALLIVLALAFFVLGLVITALKWLLILGIALFLLGAITGWLRRSG